MLMTGGHPEMGVVERALDVRKKRGHKGKEILT